MQNHAIPPLILILLYLLYFTMVMNSINMRNRHFTHKSLDKFCELSTDHCKIFWKLTLVITYVCILLQDLARVDQQPLRHNLIFT